MAAVIRLAGEIDLTVAETSGRMGSKTLKTRMFFLTFFSLGSNSPKMNSDKYGMSETFQESEVAALRLFSIIRPLVLPKFSNVKVNETGDYGNGTRSK